MEHSGVVRVLIETLCEIQISSGLPAPELTEHSKPLDLDEFDSLKCLELEVLVSEKLRFEVKGVLVPEDEPGTVLTVAEVAERIAQTPGFGGAENV